jgi:hypothetical protein
LQKIKNHKGRINKKKKTRLKNKKKGHIAKQKKKQDERKGEEYLGSNNVVAGVL